VQEACRCALKLGGSAAYERGCPASWKLGEACRNQVVEPAFGCASARAFVEPAFAELASVELAFVELAFAAPASVAPAFAAPAFAAPASAAPAFAALASARAFGFEAGPALRVRPQQGEQQRVKIKTLQTDIAHHLGRY
jgi:hypothetical protein